MVQLDAGASESVSGNYFPDCLRVTRTKQLSHSYGHTQTNYLPENFLQEFLDVVIWGHEHECIITPRRNPEMGFDVIQPGSSIATSLAEGEAVPKHVGILSITGREYKMEPIRLKTVRPFAIREIKLSDVKELKTAARKNSNRTEVTAYLIESVNELIDQARKEWVQAQEEGNVTEKDAPLPLVRIRVSLIPFFFRA